MQSDDLPEVNFCTKLEPSGMTFPDTNLDKPSVAPQPALTEEFKSPPSADLKLEVLDLEGELEKMIPESPQSSDDEKNPERNSNESIRTWLQRISQMQTEIQKKLQNVEAPISKAPPQRVVKYQDLPYMGEMTLDNSKPRRGRKPKKADICHLIYKNYGTIFPGTPNVKGILDKEKSKDAEGLNRSDVQNRIISSLLERRLTQESKRQKELGQKKALTQNEPLNLCIRDLDQLKIRLGKEVEVKSEPQSEDEVEFVQETPSPKEAGKENGQGYVYWPNGGVFIHPMALQQQLLYYQKMSGGEELRKLAPKTPKKKLAEKDSEDEEKLEGKAKRNLKEADGKAVPAKRKRSAIFIPPIPTENPNNPATEVSICKFKFTGGAKPSLQEKKMLSVDSGGNFRYYSGTGDKSMRGYEFFPRETLQQQINTAQCSSTGAFLQASGEKIFQNQDSIKPNDFMLTPDITLPQTPPAPETQPRTKKRKSRKSLHREKLEQTFKEKGFLIQTQQLESAEGATYCKFRQLRKFTRYLFRSWKDYLPGNVAEGREKGDEEEEVESVESASSAPVEESSSPPP